MAHYTLNNTREKTKENNMEYFIIAVAVALAILFLSRRKGDEINWEIHPDSLAYKMGKYLLSKDFTLANNNGARKTSVNFHTDCFGILLPDKDVDKKKLWLVGVVSFVNPKNWKVEIYGEKFSKKVDTTVAEMTQRFGGQVEIRTVFPTPKKEYVTDSFG